jgi:hypothetical protein
MTTPHPWRSPSPELRRDVLRQLTEVLVETVIINDLLNRSDLSRRKIALWYSGISTFPRLGTVAYLAARPQTRAWLARLRGTRHPVWATVSAWCASSSASAVTSCISVAPPSSASFPAMGPASS